jgi:hypothetical protein
MAHAAIGTKLKIGDGGSPVSYTTIAEVVEISGPALSVDTADATHHSSSGDYEEVVPTVIRSGEVTFDINYLPTDSTHDATDGLLNDLENKTKRNFELVFTDGSNTTWTLTGYVTGFEPSAPHDDKLDASVTIKLTGQPTIN